MTKPLSYQDLFDRVRSQGDETALVKIAKGTVRPSHPDEGSPLLAVCLHTSPSVRRRLLEVLAKACPAGEPLWVNGLADSAAGGMWEWEFVRRQGGRLTSAPLGRGLLARVCQKALRGEEGTRLVAHVLRDLPDEEKTQERVQEAWWQAVNGTRADLLPLLVRAGANPLECQNRTHPAVCVAVNWALIARVGYTNPGYAERARACLTFLAEGVDWDSSDPRLNPLLSTARNHRETMEWLEKMHLASRLKNLSSPEASVKKTKFRL